MRLTILDAIDGSKCTGCFACVNKCPKDAIGMYENLDGFLMPGIDRQKCVFCSQCVQVCPVLRNVDNNMAEPFFYAFRAQDDIRALSSSGGAFTALANTIINGGGYVCGAVFDENLSLRHVLAKDESGIAPMRRSKYVQSRINFVFREIGSLLVKGRQILFTGLPCQVAGLINYIGSARDNLFTVDLLCCGVPPEKLFKRYLHEIAYNKKIVDVSFRNKQNGWRGCCNLSVKFNDGSQYISEMSNDAYMKSYAANLIKRKSCADCKFCDFPRYGDLSIGDFWGYERYPGGDAENLGTSIVFVNNERGLRLMSNIAPGARLHKRLEAFRNRLENRVFPGMEVHAARDRFFHLVKTKSVAEASRVCLGNIFDVGIVGPHMARNIGSMLTYFALYHAICDLGYSAQMIESPSSAAWHESTHNFIDAPLYPAYAIAPSFADRSAMRALNERFGQFVVGSDQIFNPALYDNWDQYTKLDWVSDSKKKIAYAASFGFDNLECSESMRADMAYYLGKFDAFSVREASGINICRQNLNLVAEHVLDPVFICETKYFYSIADQARSTQLDNKPFIHSYILSPTHDKERIIAFVGKMLKLPFIIYPDFGGNGSFSLNITQGSLNERVRAMRDCDFTIVDSYHGLCFALIFKKNFMVLFNGNGAHERFVSLLTKLDLMDRIVYDWDDFYKRKANLLLPINYKSVYEKLDPLIQQSREWLKKNLANSKIKNSSERDIFEQRMSQLSARFDYLLNKQKDYYEAELGKLRSRLVPSFLQADEISRYLIALKEHAKSLLLLMAVRDTPAGHLPDMVISQFKDLGLSTNFNEHYRHGFAAIIDGGCVDYEQIGTNGQQVACKRMVNRSHVEIVSAPYDAGDLAKIIIDGENWAINKRGLNVVVVDKISGKVLDTVCFDTYAPDMKMSR